MSNYAWLNYYLGITRTGQFHRIIALLRSETVTPDGGDNLPRVGIEVGPRLREDRNM